MKRAGYRFAVVPLACAVCVLFIMIPSRAAEPKPESYRIPYQLTETKHILVRVKINNKGPFNFILDTGAPALYVGTHVAKKLDLKADDKGWGTFDRFEIESGLVLEKVKGRIEDPFQLIGMNKMNLMGVQLDGLIGYTVLAQYRIQFDFTKPHLVWTKLDWEPALPKGMMEQKGKVPTEVAAMSTLVQLAAMFVGRRPDPEIIRRGFLGVELADEAGELGGKSVHIKGVLPGSPAAEAGLQKGDRLTRFQDQPVQTIADVQKLAAQQPAGKSIRVEVLRDGKKIEATIKAGEGL